MKSSKTELRKRIFICDTTLRDGVQGEGISFSEDGKLRLLKMLDEFGIDYAECGFPGSNPADRDFFSHLRKVKFSHLRPIAFGSTRRANVAVENDRGLQALLESGVEVAALFGKADLNQVRSVLRVSAAENLRMIADSVRFLTGRGVEVWFDAEHFFDGCKTDFDYAISVLQTALESGASALVLCDTRGGTLPDQIAASVTAVRAKLGAKIR